MSDGNCDFSKAIDALTVNARKARNISISMTIVLLLTMAGMLTFAVYSFQSTSSGNYILTSLGSKIYPSDDIKVQIENATKIQKLTEEVARTQSTINALSDIIAKSNIDNKSDVFYRSISNAIVKISLTLSLVFFVVYIIKICLMFIRYHSQMSAQYNNLAIALIASNGDFDKALKLIELFNSPHIAMGKSPDTIYEKAFETLSKAVTSKS